MADKTPSGILPQWAGKHVHLAPAKPDDIVATYHWWLQSNPQTLIPVLLEHRTPKEAADAFGKEGRSGNHERFMIIRTKDKTPVGWVGYFNLNDHNRSTELEIVVDPDERRNGYGAEGLAILGSYLFDYRGLNKLYASTPQHNTAGIALLEESGFHQDGVLRRHYFFDGEYHDGYLYSILRFEAEW